MCCSVLQCAAVDDIVRSRLVHQSAGVLQCVAVCCSVLQCLQCVAVCYGVSLCVAVRCSVLLCVAVCCSVLQFEVACGD